MTLWNIIRDFFVDYIFGGMNSSGVSKIGFNLGLFINYSNGEYDEEFLASSNELRFAFQNDNNIVSYLGLGDWLSTTATIITLCAICVFLFFFVRWLFRLTAGLISGRG